MSLLAAVPADASELQGLAVHAELGQAGGFFHGLDEGAVIRQLFGIAAAFTEQKIPGVRDTGVRAADKGIARGNAVHQLLLEQEFQGTVDRGRRRLVAFGGQVVQQLIGTEWFMAVPDQLQHAPAQGREPGAAGLAEAVGRSECVVNAMAVVVGMEGRGCHKCFATKDLQQYNICFPGLYSPSAMSRLLCLVLLFLGLSHGAHARAPELVASIRPLALIALAVSGGEARVRQLVPNGASSHDYQLRPSDRVALAAADIILWTGPAHEQFLGKTLDARRGLLITAQALPGIRLRPLRNLDGSAVLPGTVDPHLWLDADNAVVIASAIADALARRDPVHAATYRRNAAGFTVQMTAFKNRNANRFQKLDSHAVVAYHDAYQYLEPALGLTYRGSLTAHEAGRVGARHFLQMSQRIQGEGVACLLAEPGFDAALARRAFAGRVASFTAVDEFFGAALFDGKGYATGLTQMADRIYLCLGGK